MNINIQEYLDFLKKRGVDYTSVEEQNDGTATAFTIETSFTGRNMSDMQAKINLAITERQDFSIADYKFEVVNCIALISRAFDENIKSLYAICSKLNSKYRWVKFFVDKDKHIMAEATAFLGVDEMYEGSYDLLSKISNIVDLAYPEIMKALWST